VVSHWICSLPSLLLRLGADQMHRTVTRHPSFHASPIVRAELKEVSGAERRHGASDTSVYMAGFDNMVR
jgi:hypothetical protein